MRTLCLSMVEITFREVDESRWGDFEQLFESRGGPKSCWCMVWRAEGAEARRTKNAERKTAMESRIRGGVPVGLLGYVEEVPVAWCSIAPRSTYRRLRGLLLVGEPEQD